MESNKKVSSVNENNLLEEYQKFMFNELKKREEIDECSKIIEENINTLKNEELRKVEEYSSKLRKQNDEKMALLENIIKNNNPDAIKNFMEDFKIKD